MSDLVHHEPIHRAPEVVAFEITVTLGQAYLAGVCLVLAVQTGQISLAAVVLGVLGVAAAAGYGLWLFGGPGTLMALVNVPLLLLSLFALLTSLQPDATGIAGTIVRSDALGLALQLVAAASALLGIVGGAFLPGPRRRRWHHAHRPDTALHPSPLLGTEALAQHLRASIRRLRSSGGAGQARGAPGAMPGVDDASPADDEDNDHSTFELYDVNGWDRPQSDDPNAADEPADSAGDHAPYRPPRR